jgi:hypothetical protein
MIIFKSGNLILPFLVYPHIILPTFQFTHALLLPGSIFLATFRFIRTPFTPFSLLLMQYFCRFRFTRAPYFPFPILPAHHFFNRNDYKTNDINVFCVIYKGIRFLPLSTFPRTRAPFSCHFSSHPCTSYKFRLSIKLVVPMV